MPTSKLVIPGGSGFLGGVVARHFLALGWDVVILSRRTGVGAEGARLVAWDGETLGPWASELEGATAVLNLAGRTVNCRYNAKHKQEIYDSRLKSTAVVGEAIARCATPPPVWLNSSSATIYRHALDRPMDEATGEVGKGFSVDVCQKWEAAFDAAVTPATRHVALRSAISFGVGVGGPFAAFHWLARLGLGGTLGPGNQFVSWIHERDFARAVEWLIVHEEFSGVVNLAAPNPLPNRDFMRALRNACGMPIGLPAATWMLELGAFALRTETELLLKSRRVIPTRLLNAGFQFEFTEWAGAARELVERAAKK